MVELEKLINECGVLLYDTEIANENGKSIYRIYIIKDGGITLDDCERVSKLLSPIFDVTPPISTDYILEVSSPGLERNLHSIKNFSMSIGELVKIKLADMKISGKIIKVKDDIVSINTTDGKDIDIKISDIQKARTYIEW